MLALLLASFGLAYVLGHAVISLPLRRWLAGEESDPLPIIDAAGRGATLPASRSAFRHFLVTLLECPACLGFHFGWLHEWWRPSLDYPRVIGIVAMGCIVAASNLILGRLTKLI